MKSIVTLVLLLFCYFLVEHAVKLKTKTIRIMPWMGVLIRKADNHSVEEVTNIVLIEIRIAIGNAKDIGAVDWRTLATTSRAMFYDKGNPWFCGLIGRILHPEYDEGFANTLAIVFLDTTNKPSLWNPINMIHDYKEVSRWTKIYNVGYKDSHMRLEQETYPVDFVSRTICEEFYFNQEINFEYIWPPNTMCYKAIRTDEVCVMASGMALASNSTGEWILIGLSTTGPGCSLPGRYIEILPYVKWIRDHIEVRKATRRYIMYHALYDLPGFQSHDDRYFLPLQKNQRYKNMYGKYANITQSLGGCDYAENTLIYAEEDIFTTLSPISVGTYLLTYHDKNFHDWTCAKVYTMCTARTDATFTYYNRSHSGELSQFVQTVPARPLDIDQNNTYKMTRDPVFETFLLTHHLEFKFMFDKMAIINISIYSKFNDTYEEIGK